jgi:hypothetical protein
MPAAMCAEHPERAAQGVCARCGTFVCHACGFLVERQIVCAPCSRRVDVGKAKQVPLLGVLMIASGVGGTALGLFALAFAGIIVVEIMRGVEERMAMDPYGPPPFDIDIITYAVLAMFAIGYLVSGALQVMGGIFARKRRARMFVLLALVFGMLTGLLNGLIGMLSVALGVWGIMVLTDRMTVESFSRTKD